MAIDIPSYILGKKKGGDSIDKELSIDVATLQLGSYDTTTGTVIETEPDQQSLKAFFSIAANIKYQNHPGYCVLIATGVHTYSNKKYRISNLSSPHFIYEVYTAYDDAGNKATHLCMCTSDNWESVHSRQAADDSWVWITGNQSSYQRTGSAEQFDKNVQVTLIPDIILQSGFNNKDKVYKLIRYNAYRMKLSVGVEKLSIVSFLAPSRKYIDTTMNRFKNDIWVSSQAL